MLNPDNATLEWCAKWIEDSLRAETNERTIEFGKNMAMTIRAVKTKDAAPVVATDDVGGETQTAMKPGDTVRFVRDGEQYTATIISFAPRVFGGAGCNIETTKGVGTERRH